MERQPEEDEKIPVSIWTHWISHAKISCKSSLRLFHVLNHENKSKGQTGNTSDDILELKKTATELSKI